MKAKRFILRDKGIRDNALTYIRDLPSDTVYQVVIQKYVKPRSDNQHGYYRVLVPREALAALLKCAEQKRD